jgi:hypothetical protein
MRLVKTMKRRADDSRTVVLSDYAVMCTADTDGDGVYDTVKINFAADGMFSRYGVHMTKTEALDLARNILWVAGEGS